MAIILTEPMVAEMAPNPKALLDGRGVVKKGALRKLAKSADGTIVFGLCQGSGKAPYAIWMDLDGGDRPAVKCTCPSHQYPCKHGLALMLAFVANGASFPVAEPPAEAVEKRAKRAERAEKKASTPDVPKKVNKAALAKKTQEQSDALDTLETFVLDLVSSGLGGLTAKHIKAIDTQSKRLADADMRRAAQALVRLSALVADEDDDDDDDEDDGGKKAARGLSEERQSQIASLVTQLWVTIKKGRRALEGKLDEGTTQGEADAQVESILGKAFQLPELKEAGYWVTDRSLIELAHERVDEPTIEMITATGYMLDLGDGAIHQEITPLPYTALKFAKLRGSRMGTVTIKEAGLYPGDVMNRRVRWDDRSVTERPREPSDLTALHGHARSLDALIKALRAQIKNPLNPESGVGLLSVKRFGDAGGALVAEDHAGARLVIRDPKRVPFATTRNLRYAAGAFATPALDERAPVSLAVRLHLDPATRGVVGQALALFAGGEHVRLGL